MLPHLPFLPWPTTYGLLVALGFFLGWRLVGNLAPRVGLPPVLARDTVVLAALVGLIAAKALLVVLEPWVLEDPLQVVTQAGVFYGGLIGAVVAAIVQAYRRGFDVQAFGDAAAPALALGHAFGRLGCFAAGCCWGRACDAPWGVRYTDPEAIVLSVQPWVAGVPLHPTQLYEAVAELLLAALGAWLLTRRRFVGQVWWTYVALYAIFRAINETFRGDPRGAWHGISTSQLLAGALFAVAAVMLVVQRRRARLPFPGASAPAGGGDVPRPAGDGPDGSGPPGGPGDGPP